MTRKVIIEGLKAMEQWPADNAAPTSTTMATPDHHVDVGADHAAP
jgi:hypothetical protein